MKVLVLLCLVAAAAAGPWQERPRYGALSDYVSDDQVFDTNRFWQHLEATLLEQLLEDLSKHFPSDVTTEGVEGDQYKLVVPLDGYDEKDIVVKAQPGALMIQAVRRDDAGSVSYLNARTLPSDVLVTGGRWGFDKGVLTISFPLKESAATTTETETEGIAPTRSPVSHEELEPTTSRPGGDFALRGGEASDMVGTNEIATNDIEDTTYAVDLKGDVEFVPMQVK